MQTAAIGKGKLGSTISHKAPETVAYDGKDYTRQGEPNQTFTLVSPENTFNIYYRRPYGYTVEYYYDDVKNDKKTETGSAWCKDVIEEYIDKTPDGYEHEKTENLPLTIGTDESKNVIKVYYKKIGYKVTYVPGDYGTFKTQKHDAKHGDATPAFDGETTGKPGWTFDGWEPKVADTVTGNATYTAKFVPDENQTATVLCTIDEKQIGYGTVYPSIYQTILQATGKLANGDPISGSMATANAGYKFVGWYKATGEETYEKVTDDPELKSELAESKLNRDEKTGLYRNTVFVARFEPDAGAKVPVTYEAENGTLEGTTSQEAQIVTGDGLTDVTAATPNKGYKFDGWYVVDKNGDKHLISGLDPAEKLNAETAKKNLNKDGNLYAKTTFIARFVPDTKQSAKVIYTTDGNGKLDKSFYKVTQFVQIVTGEVVREDGSVIGDKLTTIRAYPNDGYEFDRWVKVIDENNLQRIDGADFELKDEYARPLLNQSNGLYQETVFKAIFKPRTNLSYTVNYYWNGTTEKVTESKTIGGKMFGEEMTESPIGVKGYTPVSTESKTITLGTGTNEIDFYYYKNVELTANSGTLTYDGYEHGVSGFTGAPEEADFSTIKVGANGTDANTYPANFAEGTVGTVDKTEKYIVTDATDGKLVIEKRKVTLTSEGGSKVYDGTPLTKPEVQIEGSFVDGEVLGIVAQGTVTDVSEGEVTNTIFFNRSPDFKDSNYNIVQNEGKLWITPRQVTLTSETASKPYDGDPLTKPDVTVTGDGFVDGEVTDIKAKGKVTHVSEGKMTNTITYTPVDGKFDANNYTITKNEGELWITPNTDEVVVTIEGRTKTVTYNGEEHTAWQYDVVRISDPLYETAPGEVPNFWNKNAKKASGTDAGTYPMGWEAADFENKNTNFSNVKFVVTDGQLVINPRPVVLTSASDKKVYDGEALTNHTVTEMFGTESPFPNGEGLEYDFTGSQTDVGKSENTFTYKANEKTKLTNYAITTEYGTLEVTPVTDKVTVTIKGGKSSVTYNGEEHTVSGYKVSDISNPLYTANDFSFSGTAEAKGKNASLYKMGLKAADFANTSNNFTNVEFVVADGQLEITKRPVMLTSANLIKVYDGTPLTNGDTPVKEEFGTEDAFPKGEGVTYTFKGSQTNAGSSKNTFTYAWNEGTNKDNYTIYQVEGDLVVTPIDGIKVTITGHKDTQTYDGKEHFVFGYDVTVSNALYSPKEDMQFNGTDVDMTAKGTDAGTYPMELTAEDFTNKSNNFTNVTFVVTDGYVKITPRAVTLTSETAGKTYDGTALEKPVVTVGGDGFVEGQVKEIKATGSVTNAGSVANTITFTPNKETFKDGNYAITKNEGTLTIAKRSVLITSQSATKTYDGSALTRPAVTITGDGFVPGELAKAEAIGSITNVGNTPNAIRYTTTGAFNAANYSIALSVGTLTVTEKPKPEPRRTFNLTISYVYQNGKRAAASYNRGGLKNGETFDITSPVIAGYTASETVVSGTIDNRDIKVTVIYTADGVNLDDYGVPLGLGNITMNVGDCFE